jgi:hypothetical protein
MASLLIRKALHWAARVLDYLSARCPGKDRPNTGKNTIRREAKNVSAIIREKFKEWAITTLTFKWNVKLLRERKLLEKLETFFATDCFTGDKRMKQIRDGRRAFIKQSLRRRTFEKERTTACEKRDEKRRVGGEGQGSPFWEEVVGYCW